MTGGTASSRPPKDSSWLIAVVVTIATFMELLDATVVNVALPHIAGSLGAGQDESTWVLTSYLVANAISLPLSAWFSALLGRKRFYMLCVGLFTVASLACGLASTLPALLLFRVIQGLVGGGLQPCEQAILADTFPAERRGMAFAVAGIAMVSAPMLGPTLGGFIVDHVSWRWIFFVNIPIGCLSLVLTGMLIQDPPHAKRIRAGGSMDYIGLGLIALTFGSLEVVLDKGDSKDWFDSSFIVGFTAASLVAGLCAVLWELSHRQPVLDLRLFKSRNFAIANALLFLLYMNIFASTLLIPLMLQTHMGYTAMLAGLVLSPGALVNLTFMPLVGRLVNKISSTLLICTGFLLSGVALLHLSVFNLQTDMGAFLLARCLIALGIPFSFVPINTVAYRDIPAAKNNDASAILAVSRNIGGSVGIAVAISYLTQQIQHRHATLSSHITPLDANYAASLDALISAQSADGIPLQQATVNAEALLSQKILGEQTAILAYMDDFAFFGMLSILAAVLAFFLLATRKQKNPATLRRH